MSFMEKIKQIVNVDEDNYYDNDAVEEDYEEYDDYDTGREEAEEEPARAVHEPRAEANPNRVVRISNASSQLQVVLVKPDRFDDVTGIADHVNGKRTVVLNLESANRETSMLSVSELPAGNMRTAARSVLWRTIRILSSPSMSILPAI